MTTTKNVIQPAPASFDADVLERPGVTLVDFWANWCPPCRTVKPIVQELAEDQPELTVAFIDVDEHPELSQRFDITSIPALHLYKDGKLIDTKRGAHPKPVLEAWVKSAM